MQSRNVPQPGDVVVLLLAQLARGALWWGWSRVVLRSWPLRAVQGLRFAKALGSGQHGGFGLKPSLARQGLFAVFESESAADAFLAGDIVDAYRRHAGELCLVKLRATSCRGSWCGQSIAVSAEAPNGQAVASLTRASIRLHKALRFWSRSPPAEEALERAEGCMLAIGLGEAPLLRQATFSVWKNQAAMDAYARGGAHQEAILASRQGDWFSESMFVRFVPLLISGRWKGRHYG
ncbi:MAG TPA: spheroidene monooxygenase [Rubrivivax sp.]|nr:spheroidene monooxygenase [Rubrivivax sp.]